jgi:hypothetical protein
MNTTPHDSCSLAETLAYPTSLLLRNADAKRIPNSVASKDKKQFVSKRIIKVETTYLIDIRSKVCFPAGFDIFKSSVSTFIDRASNFVASR